MTSRHHLGPLLADDRLLDRLAARRPVADEDCAVPLLAALAAQTDALVGQALDRSAEPVAPAASRRPTRNPGRVRRTVGGVAVLVGLVTGTTGVAAALTGDPFSAISGLRDVVRSVAGADRGDQAGDVAAEGTKTGPSTTAPAGAVDTRTGSAPPAPAAVDRPRAQPEAPRHPTGPGPTRAGDQPGVGHLQDGRERAGTPPAGPAAPDDGTPAPPGRGSAKSPDEPADPGAGRAPQRAPAADGSSSGPARGQVLGTTEATTSAATDAVPGPAAAAPVPGADRDAPAAADRAPHAPAPASRPAVGAGPAGARAPAEEAALDRG